jgi:hypothetical protein
VRSLAALIIAILCVYLPISGQESSPSPRRSQQRANNANQSNKKGNGQNTPALQGPSGTDQTKSKNEQEKGRRVAGSTEQQPVQIDLPPIRVNPVDINEDRVDYFYIGAYLLFSLLLVVVAGYQAYMLRQTLLATRIAANAARCSAKNAQKTVTQMEEANRINRESLQAVQRAYISFSYLSTENANVTRAFDQRGGSVWTFHLPIENTGNTPARELRVRVNVRNTGTAGLPSDFSFENLVEDSGAEDPTLDFVAAKGRIYTGGLDIRDDVVRGVHAKQIRCFFYGCATYKDVFENTPPHRTEFCYELSIVDISDTELGVQVACYGKYNSQI